MSFTNIVPVAGFVALIVVAGCGSAGAVSATKSPDEAVTTWAIELHVSGGFAGIRQRLTLTSRGQLWAADLKHSKKVTRQTDQQQLAEISEMLEKIKDAPAAEKQPRKPSRCADCFQYSLILDLEGRRQAVRLDSMSVHGSPYAALISKLSVLLRQALAGANGR